MCVCVCVCARARVCMCMCARARACVCVCCCCCWCCLFACLFVCLIFFFYSFYFCFLICVVALTIHSCYVISFQFILFILITVRTFRHPNHISTGRLPVYPSLQPHKQSSVWNFFLSAGGHLNLSGKNNYETPLFFFFFFLFFS